MADDKKLSAKLGEVYRLEWTVPDEPVVNAFVNPDGTSIEFPDPDPSPEGSSPTRVEITVKKGPDEKNLQPDHFFKNRTPPFVTHKTRRTRRGLEPIKVFSATFKARHEGVFEFTIAIGSKNKSLTRTMYVRRRYDTIREVLDDPTAVRRHAILANVADFFPAFNTWTKDPSRAPKHYKKGQDSKIVDQGPWVTSYEFDGKGTDTSCTSVNPHMMRKDSPAKNTASQWAFNAGPAVGSDNPAWVFCDKDHLPSVADTYIALNAWKDPVYGHVGIVLHVPPNGQGVWVMADGGQGGQPDQLAILVPRWGLMAASLPAGGKPAGIYPEMVPEPDGGPFISGATQGDLHLNATVPQTDDDVAAIIERIQFRPTKPEHKTSCPRRMEGYVDVDAPVLRFSVVDDKPLDPAHKTKAEALETKVDNVIKAFRAGKFVGGQGT